MGWRETERERERDVERGMKSASVSEVMVDATLSGSRFFALSRRVRDDDLLPGVVGVVPDEEMGGVLDTARSPGPVGGS